MERTGYLEEAPGVRSSMRLMCLVSLIAAVALAFVTLATGSSDGVMLTLFFLTGAFAPKAVQKFGENPKSST